MDIERQTGTVVILRDDASLMPMSGAVCTETVLVLGVGNTLLRDDGFGVRVVECLRASGQLGASVRIQDGGTLGLSLLPDIEDADHLIVIDAAELNADPGALKTFENQEMDAHLSRHKSTVHEVAMVDLLAAARFAGTEPISRTLIAVQPQSLDWGSELTPPVADAVFEACSRVCHLLQHRV